MEEDNETTPKAYRAAALLMAALRGDDAAELELRDMAIYDAFAADLYDVALQAGIGRADARRPSAATTAVADQVRSAVRDLVGGWRHDG